MRDKKKVSSSPWNCHLSDIIITLCFKCDLCCYFPPARMKKEKKKSINRDLSRLEMLQNFNGTHMIKIYLCVAVPGKPAEPLCKCLL